MYTVPIIFLAIFVILLGLNIYLYTKDYAWVIKENIAKRYTAINVANLILIIVSLGLTGFYFFKIYTQLH